MNASIIIYGYKIAGTGKFLCPPCKVAASIESCDTWILRLSDAVLHRDKCCAHCGKQLYVDANIEVDDAEVRRQRREGTIWETFDNIYERLFFGGKHD